MSSSPAPTTHVGHGCPADPTWDHSTGHLTDPRCQIGTTEDGLHAAYRAGQVSRPAYMAAVVRFHQTLAQAAGAGPCVCLACSEFARNLTALTN